MKSITLKQEIINEINKCFSLTGNHEQLVNQIFLAIQARINTPIIKEFIEATPIWIEAMKEAEKISGKDSCIICGMKSDKIEKLYQALQQITNILK